jgi:hypothetical protein
MTLTFVVVGICEILTGLSLRPAAWPGRLALMAGAAAGLLVAADPGHYGGSPPHAFWAAVGFAALVSWPIGACRRGPTAPWRLRPSASAVVVAILLGLLAWFGAELVTAGGQEGLTERVLGAAQAAWPAVVVLSCRMSRASAGSGTHGDLNHPPTPRRGRTSRQHPDAVRAGDPGLARTPDTGGHGTARRARCPAGALESLRAHVLTAVSELRDSPGYAGLLARLSALAARAAGPGAALTSCPAGGVLARSGAVLVDCSLPHIAELALAALGGQVRELWTP